MKIGCDLTLISRFKNKDKLAKKILSDDEYKSYILSPRKDEFLASRFALKEALIKCLELSILDVNLKEINILKKESDAIYISYNKKIYNCSLSHEGEYCMGVVIDA